MWYSPLLRTQRGTKSHLWMNTAQAIWQQVVVTSPLASHETTKAFLKAACVTRECRDHSKHQSCRPERRRTYVNEAWQANAALLSALDLLRQSANRWTAWRRVMACSAGLSFGSTRLYFLTSEVLSVTVDRTADELILTAASIRRKLPLAPQASF